MRLAAMIAAGTVVASAAAGSAASAGPEVRVDLTIDFFSAPDFPGEFLTGTAHFLLPAVQDGVEGFRPAVPPIDVGEVVPAQTFHADFTPTDPCIGDGTCELRFAFQGATGGFPAFAFADGSVVPADPPGSPPIIPLGRLSGALKPPAIHDSGPIFAFDAPIEIGAWSVTLSAVPEPVGWALLLTGFAGLGGALRARRSWSRLA